MTPLQDGAPPSRRSMPLASTCSREGRCGVGHTCAYSHRCCSHPWEVTCWCSQWAHANGEGHLDAATRHSTPAFPSGLSSPERLHAPLRRRTLRVQGLLFRAIAREGSTWLTWVPVSRGMLPRGMLLHSGIQQCRTSPLPKLQLPTRLRLPTRQALINRQSRCSPNPAN